MQTRMRRTGARVFKVNNILFRDLMFPSLLFIGLHCFDSSKIFTNEALDRSKGLMVGNKRIYEGVFFVEKTPL